MVHGVRRNSAGRRRMAAVGVPALAGTAAAGGVHRKSLPCRCEPIEPGLSHHQLSRSRRIIAGSQLHLSARLAQPARPRTARPSCGPGSATLMKIGAGLLLLTLVAASPEIHYFRYERAIENAPQQTGQTCVALESGIFAHAAPQLADLRLYHDSNETPYVIRTASLTVGAEKSVAPLNLGVRAGQTVFDAELPDTHYSDLQLDVMAQNFIANVTVAGRRTKDGNAETKLGAYTIFDLTRQKLGRSTVLHLPESDFPFLHFRIAGPLTPENVKGLSVERLPASQPSYLTIAESRQVSQKG